MNIFLNEYKEAGFDCLFCFDGTQRTPDKWCCGFFCQGKESSLNDGLICYIPLQGKPQKIREKYLSKLFDTPNEAIMDSYKRWKRKKIK